MCWFDELLKLGDMKNRMDFAAFRELQMVGNFTNAIKHHVWSIKLEREFVVCSVNNRGLDIRLQFEEHHVTRFEGTICAMLVGILFHALLCPQ